MASLFDLGLEYKALSDLINDVEFDETTGEIIDTSEQIEQLFNDLQDDFSTKLNSCVFIIEENKSRAALLRDMVKKFQKKAIALDNRNNRLKELMAGALKQVPDKKIKTDMFSFSIRKSESVHIIDEDLISREYLKMKFEADKTKIKKALKDGNSVNGASLQVNESLNIK